MANIRVTVSGADRVARKLRNLGLNLERIDVTSEARQVERRATQEAPKRTGRLSRDLEVADRRGVTGVELGSLPYGPPIHNGHRARNIEPNPYLKRAAQRERSDVVRSVRRQVSRHIRAAGF